MATDIEGATGMNEERAQYLRTEAEKVKELVARMHGVLGDIDNELKLNGYRPVSQPTRSRRPVDKSLRELNRMWKLEGGPQNGRM